MFSRRSFLSALGISSLIPWTPASAVEPTAEIVATSLPDLSGLPEEVQFLLTECSKVLERTSFELNDPLTRTNVHSECSLIIQDAKYSRRICDGKAICDETNNTAATIDAHTIVLSVFIKQNLSVAFYGFDMTFGPYGITLTNLADNYIGY